MEHRTALTAQRPPSGTQGGQTRKNQVWHWPDFITIYARITNLYFYLMQKTGNPAQPWCRVQFSAVPQQLGFLPGTGRLLQSNKRCLQVPLQQASAGWRTAMFSAQCTDICGHLPLTVSELIQACCGAGDLSKGEQSCGGA